jgi:outer membrane protein assembly factor BamE
MEQEVNYHIGFDSPWKPRVARGFRSNAMRRFVFLLPLLLTACFLVPHKIDVQQGNYVDQQMIDKLKPDMTKSQVRFVLGTPLIADVFHPERWDYVYLAGRAGEVGRAWRVTVVFDGDRLARIEGDLAPSERMTQAPAESKTR